MMKDELDKVLAAHVRWLEFGRVAGERANLQGADLRGADLRWADLQRADLSEAIPVIPNIHREVYDAASTPGALDMSDWHTCETTHCRAGWVVALAGEAGAKLEEDLGTSAAAALIYYASDPELESVPDFHCSDAEALADMARLAEGVMR